MHDGQMLFDSSYNWNHQEWKVDETISRLLRENKILDCIVVGVWNNEKFRHSEYFPQKYFDVVKKGMYLVVNGTGTAKNVKNSEYVLSGKTGTAQTTKGGNHSWFVGFAPYDDPKIAICVLGEDAGWGAQFAAPIAAAIMVRFLSGNTIDAYNENAGSEVKD